MTWRSRAGPGLAAGLVILAASPVEAATIPQYDITLNRTRAVVFRQSALSFYSPDPVYHQVPGGATSDSTPTVIGNTGINMSSTLVARRDLGAGCDRFCV
ncbi:MAG: hypothetical protein OWU33_02445 [Firmicutes bacterium]|nr:hypothetical protein [Bacillota bacterium]